MAARKRRSVAQRRATARMIAHNPHRRRRVVHRNITANPVRRAIRRRRVSRNPILNLKRRRRHRNPSGGFLDGMVDKRGLSRLAAVVALPTIMSEGQSLIFPNATGYYKAGIQGIIGMAAGYVAHTWVDQELGEFMAAIAIGNTIAQLIDGYNAGTLSNSVMSGYGVPPSVHRDMPKRNAVSGNAEAGARTLSGYMGPARPVVGMSGYMSRAIAEPGTRHF